MAVLCQLEVLAAACIEGAEAAGFSEVLCFVGGYHAIVFYGIGIHTASFVLLAVEALHMGWEVGSLSEAAAHEGTCLR